MLTENIWCVPMPEDHGRRTRPSVPVVVAAFVVLAVPTAFTVFPEAATGQRVWWRAVVVAVWAGAAAWLGFRTAVREAVADRLQVGRRESLSSSAQAVQSLAGARGRTDQDIVEAAMAAARSDLAHVVALGYYHPPQAGMFRRRAVTDATLPQLPGEASGDKVIEKAWGERTATVLLGQPRQAAAPVVDDRGEVLGVVKAVLDDKGTGAEAVRVMTQAAELLGALPRRPFSGTVGT